MTKMHNPNRTLESLLLLDNKYVGTLSLFSSNIKRLSGNWRQTKNSSSPRRSLLEEDSISSRSWGLSPPYYSRHTVNWRCPPSAVNPAPLPDDHHAHVFRLLQCLSKSSINNNFINCIDRQWQHICLRNHDYHVVSRQLYRLRLILEEAQLRRKKMIGQQRVGEIVWLLDMGSKNKILSS